MPQPVLEKGLRISYRDVANKVFLESKDGQDLHITMRDQLLVLGEALRLKVE